MDDPNTSSGSSILWLISNIILGRHHLGGGRLKGIYLFSLFWWRSMTQEGETNWWRCHWLFLEKIATTADIIYWHFTKNQRHAQFKSFPLCLCFGPCWARPWFSSSPVFISYLFWIGNVRPVLRKRWNNIGLGGEGGNFCHFPNRWFSKFPQINRVKSKISNMIYPFFSKFE